MIKPTIGRVVWYWPEGDQTDRNPAAQPLAAIVARVWSDSCVNLMVVDQNGTPYSKTSVELYQDEGPRPAYAFAEWMSYQIGQAKAQAEKV